MDRVIEVAQRAVGRCQYIALLDTLKYLEKGGRIGKARALLGTLLKIRPMVIIRDGEIHELAKERTRARAIARLQTVATGFSPLEELCVLHTTTPDEAAVVAQSLTDLLPSGKEPFIARVGAVVGTYAGPGCLAIAMLRSEAALESGAGPGQA
jgi:DegV family protein with EDD domain